MDFLIVSHSKLLTLNWITHQLGLDRPDRHGPENATRISDLHGEDRRDLQENHRSIGGVWFVGTNV
jgi:hypothetical protein